MLKSSIFHKRKIVYELRIFFARSFIFYPKPPAITAILWVIRAIPAGLVKGLIPGRLQFISQP